MSNLPLLKSWSTIPPTPNLTLTKEREDPGFSVPIITSLLDGSPSKTARRRYIETIVCNDPVFRRRTHMKLDRVEKYKLAILKHHRMVRFCHSRCHSCLPISRCALCYSCLPISRCAVLRCDVEQLINWNLEMV